MPTLRPHRARPLRSLALPTTLALLLALAGCSNTAEIPQADPSPSASPLFASEDEALEAATAVYEEYLAASNQVLEEGGANPERIEPFLSSEIYADESASFRDLQSKGYSFVGGTQVVGFSFQQSIVKSTGDAEVQFYACVTNEGTVRVDQDREPTPEQPPTFVGTFEVVVQFSNESGSSIERKQFWSEGNLCSDG